MKELVAWAVESVTCFIEGAADLFFDMLVALSRIVVFVLILVTFPIWIVPYKIWSTRYDDSKNENMNEIGGE